MKKLVVGRLFQVLAFIGLIMPFCLLLLIKKDIYFKTATDTLKISLGVMIGMAYALILIIKALSEINKYVKPLVTLVIITLITFLFQSIIKDLFLILLTLVFGYILFLILITIANHFVEYGKEYKKTYIREEAKQAYAKDAKEKISIGGNV